MFCATDHNAAVDDTLGFDDTGAAAWPRRPLTEALAFAPLSAVEVRLWCFPLDAPLLPAAVLLEPLDADERARAARFVFERDRQRFIAAHGMLRRLLAACLGAAPASLRFRTLAQGKPVLTGSPDAEGLHFNLSHSHGWGLLGATRRAPLGVDIELVREVPEWQAIARTNFAPSETAQCLALPVAAQPHGFFATWVRKEAFIKACGAGLSMPLQDFEVGLQPYPQSSLQALKGDATAADAWRLHGWRFGPLHAAVCMHATDVTVNAMFLTV